MSEPIVTIANLGSGNWGVFSNRTHDLVGYVRRYTRSGLRWWQVEDRNGKRLSHQFYLFKNAREDARARQHWPGGAY